MSVISGPRWRGAMCDRCLVPACTLGGASASLHQQPLITNQTTLPPHNLCGCRRTQRFEVNIWLDSKQVRP